MQRSFTMDANPETPATLRQKRDELYKAARDHPGSAEDEMVEILLLSAISEMKPLFYDALPARALGEERRRFDAARQQGARKLQPKRGKRTGTAAGLAGKSVAELKLEVETRQERLEKIEETLKSAQAAMAAGKQITDLEIYQRIWAVIGLTPPLEAVDGRGKENSDVK
jgi:hypothetical protein